MSPPKAWFRQVGTEVARLSVLLGALLRAVELSAVRAANSYP